MTIKDIVDTLDEMIEKRPSNPEWWNNWGNKAISQAVMIIRRYQNIMSVHDWVDADDIEKEESR